MFRAIKVALNSSTFQFLHYARLAAFDRGTGKQSSDGEESDQKIR